MMLDKIIEFVKQWGYDNVEYETKWKGYKCYRAIRDTEEALYTGLPLVIMVKGDEIRAANADEVMEYLQKL